MRALPVVLGILVVGTTLAFGQGEQSEEAVEPQPKSREEAPAAETSDDAPAQADEKTTPAKPASTAETAEKEVAERESSHSSPAVSEKATPPAKTDGEASSSQSATSAAVPAEAPEESGDTPAPAADSAAGGEEHADSDSGVEETNESMVVEELPATVLTVLSVPAEAVIVVDGTAMGKTPVILDQLTPGEHAFEIRKKGHFLKRATVRVAEGIDDTITFELSKPAEMIVTSFPAGATVRVDDDSVGVTPFGDATLKPARYQVAVGAAGYETAVREVSLKDGARDSVHVVLVEKHDTAAGKADTGRRGKGRLALIDKIALGIFLGFSVVILTVELAGTRE